MRILLFISLLLSIDLCAQAHTFALNQSDVVGQVTTTISKPGDTLAQIARDHDMGYVEMEEANPGISDPDHLTPGTVLVVPSQFVLPNAPHKGIVVNLAEMRLYYFGNGQVVTHPMGIGREGEDTPLGKLSVIEHIPNPTWYAPESIRKMRAAQGVFIPKVVPPGPDNPLGHYALRLSRPTYLIHGTNDPLGGIGRRSSSGCLRMYPEDIQSLYGEVKNGTSVYIVDEPYKAGWSSQGQLYMESHIPLNASAGQAQADAPRVRQLVQSTAGSRIANVNWDHVQAISSETQGIPQPISNTP